MPHGSAPVLGGQVPPAAGNGGRLPCAAAGCQAAAELSSQPCVPAAPQPLHFTAAGGRTEAVAPGAPNLLFLLNSKFRLEGFSLWLMGIVEKNEFWEQHDLFTRCYAGEVLHLCFALPLLWSRVLLELQVVWAGIEILLPECIGL